MQDNGGEDGPPGLPKKNHTAEGAVPPILLHMAAIYNVASCVQRILAEGADVFLRCSSDMSALDWAAALGHVSVSRGQ